MVTGGDGIVGTAAAQALRAHQSFDCDHHHHHHHLRLVHLPMINFPVFLAGRRYRGECSRDRWLVNRDPGHRRYP